MRGSLILRVARQIGRLHVILHHTATAESATTARAQRALGLAHDRRAVLTGLAGNRERLLLGRGRLRRQCRAANPELHHGQQNDDRRAQCRPKDQRHSRDKPLHDAGQREQLEDAPDGIDRHNCRDGKIVPADIVGPGGYFDDTLQRLHVPTG